MLGVTFYSERKRETSTVRFRRQERSLASPASRERSGCFLKGTSIALLFIYHIQQRPPSQKPAKVLADQNVMPLPHLI